MPSLSLTTLVSNSSPARRLTTPYTALLSHFLPVSSPYLIASPAASRYKSPIRNAMPFSLATPTACATSLTPSSRLDAGSSPTAGRYATEVSLRDTPSA
ncbi:hypothetical protein ACJQWK_05297 [Exserohilum turcicum]